MKVFLNPVKGMVLWKMKGLLADKKDSVIVGDTHEVGVKIDSYRGFSY